MFNLLSITIENSMFDLAFYLHFQFSKSAAAEGSDLIHVVFYFQKNLYVLLTEVKEVTFFIGRKIKTLL